MSCSISVIKEHFKNLENSVEQKLINVDNELSKATQSEHTDFQMLNGKIILY